MTSSGGWTRTRTRTSVDLGNEWPGLKFWLCHLVAGGPLTPVFNVTSSSVEWRSEGAPHRTASRSEEMEHVPVSLAHCVAPHEVTAGDGVTIVVVAGIECSHY